MDKADILREIYTNTHDPEYIVDGLEELNCIIDTPIDEIFGFIIDNHNCLSDIKANNIPQFSNRDDVFKVVAIVLDSPEKILSWSQIGYYLCPKGSKEGAKTKYGENHYKLAVQLGLAKSDKIEITELGIAVNLQMDQIDKNMLIAKLSLRIPIIQSALIEAKEHRVNMSKKMGDYLSPSTVVRRRSNVRTLLNNISSGSPTGALTEAILNIVWTEEEE